MSIFRNDTVGSWTRGGQAVVHNVRMSTQVFFQTMVAGFILWVMGAIWYALERSSAYERFVCVKLFEAALKVDAAGGTNDPVLFRTPEGYRYWTSADWLFSSDIAHRMLHRAELDLVHGAMIAGVCALGVVIWSWIMFARTGKDLGSNQFLRGARFGSRLQLCRLLRHHENGSFAIGGVPMPKAFEPEHILICGAPGTGKTNLIIQMLDGIRRNQRRAIVYDTAGAFVEKFYRPGIDLLLNPLDERTDNWSPWRDVPRDYHYDQIAESTIPEKGGDPFWTKAARGTLVAVLRELARQDRMQISALLNIIIRSKLKDLAAFAQGTDAAAFISTEGERTSAGIQAELASVMRSFAYLKDTENSFSIRDWVANETDDSWLFVTVKADQLPSLRPLITVWLDIAISAIMSLAANQDRRLYCVIDELPSLQRLPSLSDFLARARKYGGCGILGFQSYPQLEATYGVQDAAAITGYCSTWVALRANDTPTAKHVSENLGQVEQVEANEGMSYGVNDMRDGVNLSRVQVTRPLVLHTEVTNLPNLTGFLRFGRNLPVLRFDDRYNAVKSVCDAFIERDGLARKDTPAAADRTASQPHRPKRATKSASSATPRKTRTQRTNRTPAVGEATAQQPLDSLQSLAGATNTPARSAASAPNVYEADMPPSRTRKRRRPSALSSHTLAQTVSATLPKKHD